MVIARTFAHGAEKKNGVVKRGEFVEWMISLHDRRREMHELIRGSTFENFLRPLKESHLNNVQDSR